MTRNIALLAGAFLLAGAAVDAKTLVLPSTPATVYKGPFSPKVPAVLHVQPGDTVTIDTVNGRGGKDAAAFFAKAGVQPKDILEDENTINNMPTKDYGFAHPGGKTMTGPIYIEGAEPGDKLEVRILKVTPRAPYGVNNVGNGGAAPGMFPKLSRDEGTHIIRYDIAKKTVNFSPDIHFPTRPFVGTMAVETPAETSSQPPGRYGGNMDFQKLQAGSTLYLPVLVKGGMFVAGDSHAGQGDGEVSGNAIEASMALTVEFIVHKGEGKEMDFPYAEDAKNFYILGMDLDLGKALASSIKETVKFLGTQYGMSAPDAYSLCSTILDFSVAEAVDTNLVMCGTVPKAYFKKKFPYWKTA